MSIRRIFLKPHTIILSFSTYIYMLKMAKNELLSNPETSNLHRSEIFFKATQKIKIEDAYEIGRQIEKKMGVFIYVLPLVFWFLIIRTIAQIIF